MLNLIFAMLSCGDEAPQKLKVVTHQTENIAVDWSTASDEARNASLRDFARVSLDIRGRRPSPTEIEGFLYEDRTLEDWVNDMLQEKAFATQMAWYWNDSVHTAVWIGQNEIYQTMPFIERRSIGWEPLAFVEKIVEEGRPFTDLVTVQEQPTDTVLGELWNMPGTDNWDWASSNFAGEKAGMITSRVLWMRYHTDLVSFNRARANHFSRLFLCYDFLDRNVVFDFSILSESLADMDTAIQTAPECVSCHASLDSLAVFFGAFQDSTNLTLPQKGAVSPFKASWFAGIKKPKYFGLPASTIGDLGRYVAEDPRFAQCAVQRVWEGLLHETPERNADFYGLVRIFTESNYSIATVVKRIVLSQRYLTQSSQILRPEQLQNTIAELAQITEENGNSDQEGLGPIVWNPQHRLLFGASNDVTVLHDNPFFSVSHHVFLEWVADRMAELIVADYQRPVDQRQILTLATNTDMATVVAQIIDWKIRLHSEKVDSTDTTVQQLYSLWNHIANQQGEDIAWATIFAVLIQDPKAVLR